MNPIVAFVLGLLAGLLIIWLIDMFYWRGKRAESQARVEETSRRRITELEQEIASYKGELAGLRAENDQLKMKPVPQRDALGEINGVTPEMVVCLNEAGVYTFADLGALRPSRLREIAGQQMEAPNAEVEIIRQARLAAGTMRRSDDLETINGIGPVIAKTLNYAGIFTFADLSHLTQEDLRGIVGDQIQRLANEEKIIDQARRLADQ